MWKAREMKQISFYKNKYIKVFSMQNKKITMFLKIYVNRQINKCMQKQKGNALNYYLLFFVFILQHFLIYLFFSFLFSCIFPHLCYSVHIYYFLMALQCLHKMDNDERACVRACVCVCHLSLSAVPALWFHVGEAEVCQAVVAAAVHCSIQTLESFER